MRLLLIEDNDRLSILIADGLKREGFEVDRVGSVAEGLSALATTHFVAMILDLGLPDGDGLSIIQAVRHTGNTTPILILTARQSVHDKVQGLHQGADDYLSKPFAFEELVARLRALLRRPAAYLGRELTLGRLTFDTQSREVLVDGRHFPLGSREAVLLEALLRRGNHVVPKKIMEDQLYGLSEEGSANAVEVSIHRLRRQLDESGADVAIHTIRGVGYLIKQENSLRRAPSILARIVALHLAVFAGISVTIVAAAFLLLNATVNSFEETVLQGHAKAVSQYLHHTAGSWRLSLPNDLAPIYRRGLGSFSLAVITDDGHTLFSSFPPGQDTQGTERHSGFSYRRIGDSAFYAFTLPYRQDGHAAWIQVGQNLANPDVIVDDVVTQFVRRIAWLILPILAFIFAVDVLLLRRQFRPVLVASQIASSVRPGNALNRLPLAGLPREVLPLAEAVNQALERLEKALRAQREFTADAAHELRTPLAILRTEIETNLDPTVARRLYGDIDAMSHILDQLLELAELEGEGLERTQPVDLAALAADVVGQLAPLALAQDRTIEVEAIAPVVVRGNYHLLFRAVRNLVDNAIRHAPKAGHVMVTVAAPGALAVADDGPGIPPPERELVFRRFWRRNRDTREHAGLGLAIVAKIIQLHGGTVAISESGRGGALVSIQLPA